MCAKTSAANKHEVLQRAQNILASTHLTALYDLCSPQALHSGGQRSGQPDSEFPFALYPCTEYPQICARKIRSSALASNRFLSIQLLLLLARLLALACLLPCPGCGDRVDPQQLTLSPALSVILFLYMQSRCPGTMHIQPSNYKGSYARVSIHYGHYGSTRCARHHVMNHTWFPVFEHWVTCRPRRSCWRVPGMPVAWRWGLWILWIGVFLLHATGIFLRTPEI